MANALIRRDHFGMEPTRRGGLSGWVRGRDDPEALGQGASRGRKLTQGPRAWWGFTPEEAKQIAVWVRRHVRKTTLSFTDEIPP
jgi:hypothetical protein